MAFGNFRETSENTETNEARETTDNTEKSRNQILETPENYDDDFDNKLDSNEANENNEKRQTTENNNSEENIAHGEKENVEEKNSLLDRMKNLFSKKENNEKVDLEGNNKINDSCDKSESTKERNSFVENLRESAPSYEEQAKNAKIFDGPEKDSYLDQRAKSERAYEENPNKKSWELSSEQMDDYKKAEAERLEKL